MTTYLLDAGRAAWTSEDRPQDSYYNTPTLALDGTGADEKRAYVWFPNPTARASDVVLRAVLTVYLSNAWSGTTVLTVERISEQWTQRDIKFGAAGNTPNVSANNSSTQTVIGGAAGDRVDIDVTGIYEDVAAGSNYYGLRLTIDTNGTKRIHSPDSTTPRLRPVLAVDVTTKPDAPDNLRPDGSAFAISDSAPTFRWEYSSSDTNAYQYESQVQVTTVEGSYTTGLVYDSDWQVNDITDWNVALDPTNIPTFVDNTTHYWRVRVRDQNGQESPWSDEATFERQSLGDVQIDSPSYDGVAVSDNSPTVTWYTDDLRQSQTRIRVYEGAGNVKGDLLYERPWAADGQDLDQNGDQVGYDSFTVPSTIPSRLGKGDPIITLPGATYAVEVAVRDAYSRRDDDFVSDTRYFVFTPDASITAPTAAAASASIGVVTLTWTRTTTPDAFLIIRNSEVIDTVDGIDALISGTSFQYIDYSAKPGVAYTYEVRAKTYGTGAISAASVAAPITVVVVGVWLYDPANDTRVAIMGNGEIAKVLEETSASFAPLNRQDSVRVVSRIGGYSGKVSGTIAPWLGVLAKTYVSRLEDIIGKRSTANLRLVFGDQNIAVNVGNLTVSQQPELAGNQAQYDVEFDYWQVGNFSVATN